MQKQRREFLLKTATTAGVALAASAAASSLVLTGCTLTGERSSAKSTPVALRQTLNAESDLALQRLYRSVKGSRELVAKSQGILIFPSVTALGFIVGGQHGKGVFRTGNLKLTQGYYSIASGSIGFQVGAQSKALFFLFMTNAALANFRSTPGWSVGADGSVALLQVGANGAIDTFSSQHPIVAFALTNKGLMANLTLEGTKISKLAL